MKNSSSIFLQAVLSVLLMSSFAFAAPNLVTVDGLMSPQNGRVSDDWNYLSRTTDWNNRGNVHEEWGYSSGEEYDAEILGLYVNDDILYLGLHTDFDIQNGRYDGGDYIAPGDFMFQFGNSSQTTLAIGFNIDTDDSVSLTMKYDSPTTSDNDLTSAYPSDYPTDFNKNIPFRGDSSFTETIDMSKTMNKAVFKEPGTGYNFTLEAAIDLNELSGNLAALFQGTNMDINMHWQMACGNDILYVADEYSYDRVNATPEPATMILFGMGLLGAGAYGRKRQKKEEK